MAMGKRGARQEMLFIAADQLPQSDGHPFYKKLNILLAEAKFDEWLEKRCSRYYSQEERRGQPSVPPGVYFRMLLVGYFEDIESQRGIAWRCGDSVSLREFLGVARHKPTPDHTTMSLIRGRLPAEVFDEVFQFVLMIAGAKKLLSAKTVGVDSTLLEANAAMKSIVRRDTGEDWREYVTRLMQEEGVIGPNEEPSAEDVRNYDKQRVDKKVPNDEWVSPNDADSRIAKMKDGRTHLAYKAEHVVDLSSELIVAAEIYHADVADTHTLVDSLLMAQVNLNEAGVDAEIVEVAADKGYQAEATLEQASEFDFRTYIPEKRRPAKTNSNSSAASAKSPAPSRAVLNNRRRMARAKGKRLQRQRSERVERSFAHVCNTGGARRSWLTGIEEVTKRYRIAAAAHNLGRIMRMLFGVGKPKRLQGTCALALFMQLLAALFWFLSQTLTTSPREQRRPEMFAAGR